MDAPNLITSRDNQHLKFARRVRDGYEASYIFIEGRRLCEEAVNSNLRIDKVFCTEEFASSTNMPLTSDINSSEVYVISEQLLKSLADTANPQGIVMLVDCPQPPIVESLFSQSIAGSMLPILVYLDRVNNPSNLGAVIRTAEAAGVAGVIVSKGSADPFSAKSLRASMGSAFRLPIVYGEEIRRIRDIAVQTGIRIFAVDPEGIDLHTEVDWTQPSLLVFGSEAGGLPDEVMETIERSIRISIEQQVESLNLAVACGIVLFEARRQNLLSDR